MSLRDALRIPAAEITDEAVYRDRRRLLAAMAAAPALSLAGCAESAPPPPASNVRISPEQARAGFVTDEVKTSYQDVTTYNNFYEFGTGKSDPSRAAKTLQTSPWSVAVGGERSRARCRWQTCSRASRRPSASTACVAWKAGRW